ncbi:hypothetical protein B0E46_08480 [Rhodanobacter sp. B04]|uniref:hypothetical protein n=1 Tax=Rhodanobacter sp. B04 TaxID=1945860 RepID=UPI000986E9F5|nr:hypothetical protein [Rhodanobacter sp. B04]OOG63958.1 hypothetical protein B0E46_08480 [Rhodanobacter sp. B04]
MLRRSPGLLGFGLLGVWLLLAAPLLAQDVPPPLRDWQGWVLHDVPQHGCPFLANQPPGDGSYQCAWPGRLTLDADKDGGRFSLDVHVDAPSWVALPGDNIHWPQEVTLGKQPAIVLEHENAPMLRLEPGDYQVKGTLPWVSRPAILRVPAAIGLITLTVDGAAVTRIEREDELLTLGEAANAQRAADALSLRVYRRLADGLPATLETQLQFNVTGTAREQVLGPALPDGFVATALRGDLPARLEKDGRLRVQLRPGQSTLTLVARSVAPLARIGLTLPPSPWPKQEVWSYADDNALRSTRVEGNPIDANQAGVPDDWNMLPAYLLDGASGLNVEQGNRGNEGGQGDALHLQREMWLAFDGRDFSIADHLTGELRHHQRLEVAAPWELQRASESDEPLLVTRDASGHSGVEVRDRTIDVSAGLKLPAHAGAVPSSGWQVPLENIDATLHLPHGYRLLGAIGADRSADSWAAQWNLLDLFVVALIALLAGRLLGWPWALLAAGYLVLAQHEHMAPLWTVAVALALALLLRALPEGRLHLFARCGAIGMFVLAALWALPFAASQLQYALHPQLEESMAPRMVSAGYAPQVQDVMEDGKSANRAPSKIVQKVLPPPPPGLVTLNEAAAPALAGAAKSGTLQTVVVTGSQISITMLVADDRDTHTVIQAGAGTPGWNEGNNYRLGWSGPVTPQQTTRLVIAPAWLVRIMRVLMIGLLGALLGRLMMNLLLPLRGRGMPSRGAGVAAAALLAMALLPTGSRAQAMPDQQLLNQLRSRLTEAPKCSPQCAELAQAQLQVNGAMLDLELEAHAGTSVALPLPTSDDAMPLADVSLDGHADPALLRDGEQLLLRLDRGVHRISLHYRLDGVESAAVHFALAPQHIAFIGPGWSLEGVDDGRVLGDSITLRRAQTAANGKSLPTTQSFPPYVRLTRKIGLGLDWFVSNQVERIAPQDGGFSISLPLLPGEHPKGEGVLVRNGRIDITFKAGESVVSWESQLDRSAGITLHAPPLDERAEVWKLGAAPMWHVDAKGVPTSDSDDDLRFDPLPGESLRLAITRPVAIAGDSLAIDSMQLTSSTGERASELVLNVRARSTRGGEHSIDLPLGSELLDAKRDNESINLAIRDGKLSLPLLPGTHDYVLRLRGLQGMAARVRAPSLDLHAPVANIEITLQLPQDRWLLWTWGPTDGPAVLYWSQLLVLLLASWLLARHAPTPLRFSHWLLLGLGFSAFAWSAYALVVLWLILLGLRARMHAPELMGGTRFNLLQFGLAALTMLSLVVLIGAVPQGLLGLPDMHVAGNGSTTSSLHWFADQSSGALPEAGVFSVPLWAYKFAMLAWALWLANALIGWLRWAFDAWTRGGYWRKPEPKPAAIPPQLPPSSTEPSPDA